MICSFPFFSLCCISLFSYKRYELKNHLGNVLSVITDRKIAVDNVGYVLGNGTYISAPSNNQLFLLSSTGPFVQVTAADLKVDYYMAEIVKSTEYSCYGVELAGWGYINVESYRYGFNGKELDKDGMGGGGSTYDYGFRIYNPALGKFLSVDPLSAEYPWYTSYQFAGNSIIGCVDIDGLEPFRVRRAKANNTTQLNKAKSAGRFNFWRSRKFKRRSNNLAGTGHPEVEVLEFIPGNGYQTILDADGPYRKTFTKWIVYDSEGDVESVNYDMDGDGKPEEVYYSEKYKKKLEGFQFSPSTPEENTYDYGELEAAFLRAERGDYAPGDGKLLAIFYSRNYQKWIESKPQGAGDLLYADCRQMAKTIQGHIGGKLLYIASRNGGRMVAVLPNCETVDVWFYHVAVVKGEYVFDSITGPDGMHIDEYKRIFTQEAKDGETSIEFTEYDEIAKLPQQ